MKFRIVIMIKNPQFNCYIAQYKNWWWPFWTTCYRHYGIFKVNHCWLYEADALQYLHQTYKGIKPF